MRFTKVWNILHSGFSAENFKQNDIKLVTVLRQLLQSYIQMNLFSEIELG